MWGYVEQKGAWLNFSDDFIRDLKEAGIEFPESIQGGAKFEAMMDKSQELKSFLFQYISGKLTLTDGIHNS
jgi:hypothetical protein